MQLLNYKQDSVWQSCKAGPITLRHHSVASFNIFFTKRCNFLARTHPFTCQTINLLVERRSGNTKLTSHIDTSPITSRFWHFQISILEHVAFDSRGACYITHAPSRWLAPSYYWIYFSSNFINIPWQLISPLPRLLPRRGVRHVPLRGLRNYQERWCRRTEIPAGWLRAACEPPAARLRPLQPASLLILKSFLKVWRLWGNRGVT